MNRNSNRWHHELTRYHWFVLAVAALGWLFDTMDQQLFTLARKPAMEALLPAVDVDELMKTPRTADDATSKAPLTRTEVEEEARRIQKANEAEYGGYATSIFLIGWASGGLAFGVLGDRIGRAKTMMWTIFIYSVCTGLSALSTNVWDFSIYRFLTGLGVGGEFAVGVSLVAEVMPDRARPFALGLLQALSAVGNVSAALIGMVLGQLAESGVIGSSWRAMFVVGTIPALLALVIRRRLKEPERWQAAVHADVGKKVVGSYAQLFGDARWRKNAIVGLLLAFSGVVGLWGIGFFMPDLLRTVLRPQFEAQGLAKEAVDGKLTLWVSINSMMQNVGGFFGIYAFSLITHRIGRRRAFVIAFLIAMVSTALVFWFINDVTDIFWMTPIMGFCQLSLFGGYAIYFPELFPTRLRSTGVSFCYNVGRFVAAVGPSMLGLLTSQVFIASRGYEREPMRYAGVAMCAVFLLGLCALPFAPETKDKPLPE
jgi:MFS family permease